MNLFSEAGRLQEEGSSFAIATIISAKGSTPRNTAKMIVKSDGSILGTIGGGLAEKFVIEEALAAIRLNRAKVVEYNLNSEASDGIQMLCGGIITVFIEVVLSKPGIVMIGAGHVGMAVAKMVDFLEYRLCIVDNRPEFANPEKYPTAAEIACEPDIRDAIAALHIDSNSYIIIATADVDYPAILSVINTPAAYIGMIGSKRKVALISDQLQQEGIAAERLTSIFAPVGLDIGAETPAEIAVSIMAEIIKVRNGKTGSSLREI